ncbi:helix-turn-helix domain-containing protein, partial [Clostridium sp. ZS2-4]
MVKVVKINKAYKFRIYPNENQREIIEKSFG